MIETSGACSSLLGHFGESWGLREVAVLWRESQVHLLQQDPLTGQKTKPWALGPLHSCVQGLESRSSFPGDVAWS